MYCLVSIQVYLPALCHEHATSIRSGEESCKTGTNTTGIFDFDQEMSRSWLIATKKIKRNTCIELHITILTDIHICSMDLSLT